MLNSVMSSFFLIEAAVTILYNTGAPALDPTGEGGDREGRRNLFHSYIGYQPFELDSELKSYSTVVLQGDILE